MFVAFCYVRVPTSGWWRLCWTFTHSLLLQKQRFAVTTAFSEHCYQFDSLLPRGRVESRPFSDSSLTDSRQLEASYQGFTALPCCLRPVCSLCCLVAFKRSEHFASFGEVATEMSTTSEESGWMNSTTGQRKTFYCSFKLPRATLTSVPFWASVNVMSRKASLTCVHTHKKHILRL